MVSRLLVVCFISLVIALAGFYCSAYGESSQWIHPRNKIIAKLFPRNSKMTFPEVPRVTAREAFLLYKRGQAFFVHIGEEGGDVPGCLRLRGRAVPRIDPNKLLAKIKQRYIILY